MNESFKIESIQNVICRMNSTLQKTFMKTKTKIFSRIQ
ncbi:hypothetical protein LEP1GSC132_4390 [Leptospira kirschneri str. 200803703]|uniref:Uncharacterized protein n=1 Tax=Leptospira kirschneri str. 200802841 TaxID=1193047 RepID=A0A828Y064_9LEPT|nr:hypothetical protein LEP1GSC044_1908 [Leptospira kirschneri serovar Grippotyphosa str. RM52]EKO50294.1 hypothetical protein LEP1GSC131_2836 [Leptospira kirschneri str. 200802841]EKP05007.1 hypothetical protein LEP1GSC018_2669 [Leptospira kirschneri str. 2008720114]EKQ82173.1 hypothetical protein LEP1GSC064_4071 [Leptospira kirschneri serovar Grippotyphosa str. Moskva]EKR06963.1 hypothetical protein LEP1GSC122_3596 [Leptospira kirschneri serovar Valbuzzi str. 200702274]EMJ85316.1 hypothetica